MVVNQVNPKCGFRVECIRVGRAYNRALYIPLKWRKYTPRVLVSNKISVEDEKIIIAEIFMFIMSYVAPPRTVQECLVQQSRRT